MLSDKTVLFWMQKQEANICYSNLANTIVPVHWIYKGASTCIQQCCERLYSEKGVHESKRTSRRLSPFVEWHFELNTLPGLIFGNTAAEMELRLNIYIFFYSMRNVTIFSTKVVYIVNYEALKHSFKKNHHIVRFVFKNELIRKGNVETWA